MHGKLRLKGGRQPSGEGTSGPELFLERAAEWERRADGQHHHIKLLKRPPFHQSHNILPYTFVGQPTALLEAFQLCRQKAPKLVNTCALLECV